MGRIVVRVQPRAREDEIAGERNGARRASSRDKVIEVEGMDADALRRRLAAGPAS